VTMAVVAVVAALAVAVLALVAVGASSSAATARVEAARLGADLLIARAELDAAKHSRRQAEARAAALEEELAHLDQETPLPIDAAGARARTLRLLRRWADAGAVPATDPAAVVPDPAPTEPADGPAGP
jgi:hypothetical protein